jgi:hypothetical protein
MAQFRKDIHKYLNDGKTIFEVMMLADQYGNLVGPANPSGTAVDAFGRARTSSPLTLFDSSHRYRDNGLWATSTATGGSTAFLSNEGCIGLNVDTTANAEVVRETYKVFAYQPGKSLQILNTFVFNPAKANLRQRLGYYGAQNGIYVELDGTTLNFVKRSYVSGSLQETRVAQASWNVDKMDGTGPSQLTLDISKAQIFWMDIEWLGLGSVRMGFVINGQLIHCHTFHHANLITTPYITTACLPLRYEIKNTAATATSSTLRQVCSTVISEGGYQLQGMQKSVGTPITAAYALSATPGTFSPVVSIRLKADALDAISILSALSLMGVGNGKNFEWRVTSGATVTTTSWTSAGTDSAVEYTTTGTAVTGGKILASGFFNSSNQSTPTISIPKDALFKFQLERNGLTSAPLPITLEVAAATASESVFATLDWEEVTR